MHRRELEGTQPHAPQAAAVGGGGGGTVGGDGLCTAAQRGRAECRPAACETRREQRAAPLLPQQHAQREHAARLAHSEAKAAEPPQQHLVLALRLGGQRGRGRQRVQQPLGAPERQGRRAERAGRPGRRAREADQRLQPARVCRLQLARGIGRMQPCRVGRGEGPVPVEAEAELQQRLGHDAQHTQPRRAARRAARRAVGRRRVAAQPVPQHEERRGGLGVRLLQQRAQPEGVRRAAAPREGEQRGRQRAERGEPRPAARREQLQRVRHQAARGGIGGAAAQLREQRALELLRRQQPRQRAQPQRAGGHRRAVAEAAAERVGELGARHGGDAREARQRRAVVAELVQPLQAEDALHRATVLGRARRLVLGRAALLGGRADLGAQELARLRLAARLEVKEEAGDGARVERQRAYPLQHVGAVGAAGAANGVGGGGGEHAEDGAQQQRHVRAVAELEQRHEPASLAPSRAARPLELRRHTLPAQQRHEALHACLGNRARVRAREAGAQPVGERHRRLAREVRARGELRDQHLGGGLRVRGHLGREEAEDVRQQDEEFGLRRGGGRH